jgi:hypothetical protein
MIRKNMNEKQGLNDNFSKNYSSPKQDEELLRRAKPTRL